MIDELLVSKHSIETKLKSFRDQAGLYLENSPGREEVLQQIAAMEGKLAKLNGISDQVDKLLNKHGVSSIKAFEELKRAHQNTIKSQPQKMWDLLVITRGAGKYGKGDHTTMLPSDIIQLPEYAVEEDKTRAKIEEARKAIGPVSEDLKAVHALVDEAKTT